MRANHLQMGPTFKDKVMDNVRTFNRKHKYLRFLGTFYAIVALILYRIALHFCSNAKRYTCLASILFFFISISSFTYPEAIGLNVSFVIDFTEDEDTEYFIADSLEEVLPESEAELAQISPVDKDKILSEEDTNVSEDQELKEGFLLAGDIENLEDSSDSEYVDNEEKQNEKFDKDDWKIILVNKQHPIPDNYEFPLGEIDDTMKCDERVLSPLKALLKAAAADGINLAICSPYRDSARQENLFSRKINNYLEAGLSYMEAYNASSQAVTVPGASEHQIGLAFDIVCGTYYNLDEGFGDTAEGKWLADNSYKYGFVVRYLKGKENITGIEYEPWHFRYVGVDAATIMYNENLCLEEFWDNYLYD
ncbi:M15 family metallopeptidase [Butyrivibrio sp. WCE2006]|uniref:M15 family metallopeptidase n=1 Tax=Butyrivibrio sp. WCE2006 TaxID=1410611 RepID=UPI000678D1FC|nr:M15 family metallopeptidase [Butyrivibrio sp. WCE2006]